MAETTTYQCPSCNGRLSFDGTVGKLRCEYCGSAFTPAEVEAFFAAKQEKADAQAAAERREEFAASGETGVSAAAASTSAATHVKPHAVLTGDPIKDYIAQSKWTGADVENMRAYNCPSCGAQLMVDQVTAVTSCPYCGNNTVVPGQLSDVLRPDYVIPFKLDREAAVSALKKYYGGKPLLPSSFTANNHIEDIQGVYVPFWLYTGTATGECNFDARNVRTWTDSRNMYTETDHYDVQRVGTMKFARVPVDGSTKMPDAHMDAIEPYDYSELVPFSVAYLPGFLTDRYDLDVQQCDARARGRVENTCLAEVEGTAGGYMEAHVTRSKADVKWTNISYALLPVWMLHTKWNGEDYLFAMNGQTGKFIGDLPIDNGKVVKRFLMMFAPLAVIIALIIVFVFGGFVL